MNIKEMLKKTQLLIYVGIMVLMLVLSLLSFVGYQRYLRDTLMEKSRSDLKTYTDQSVLLANRMVADYFEKLEVFSAFCNVSSGVNDDEIIALLRQNNQEDSQSRMGVAGADGVLYLGNGEPVDISGREYFKKAMRGEKVVSEVIENGFHHAPMIVLAEPVRTGGEITGIVCIAYDVQRFTDLLGTSQFEGYGATLIMQRDGVMVSSYAGMENYRTFYEALSPMEYRDGESLKKFETEVKAGKAGFLTYYNYGKGRYLYFEPAGINDWVVISLVVSESMDRELSDFSMQALVLMVKNVLFYCVILACIWLVVRHGNRTKKNSELDALTQIYNKSSARSQMTDYLKKNSKKTHACLFMDIDNFKLINDEKGHGEGDRVLVELARMLQSVFRKDDVICRFGGDEFMVWMKDIPSPNTAGRKVQELLKKAEENANFPASLSVGITCYPGDGGTYDVLLDRADKALYQAKKRGKNRFEFYNG